VVHIHTRIRIAYMSTYGLHTYPHTHTHTYSAHTHIHTHIHTAHGRHLGVDMSSERAQWLEQQYDRNGDGRMDFEEFKVGSYTDTHFHVCMCVCCVCLSLSLSLSLSLCVHIYICFSRYVYIYILCCVCVRVLCIQRGGDIERGRERDVWRGTYVCVYVYGTAG
jgi:hypothetical protein